jgi:hypothetical protein
MASARPIPELAPVIAMFVGSIGVTLMPCQPREHVRI